MSPPAAGSLRSAWWSSSGASSSPAARSVITYYILFALSAIIVHHYLARTCRALADNLGGAFQSLGVGLVALYGLNELIYRLTYRLAGNRTNLNDTAIFAQMDAAPHMTFLVVVFLAPFVDVHRPPRRDQRIEPLGGAMKGEANVW